MIYMKKILVCLDTDKINKNDLLKIDIFAEIVFLSKDYFLDINSMPLYPSFIKNDVEQNISDAIEFFKQKYMEPPEKIIYVGSWRKDRKDIMFYTITEFMDQIVNKIQVL